MPVLALLLALPAAAQNSLPGLNNFTLDTRPTPQPVPSASPTAPAPTPSSATPAATPAPVATAVPRATSTVRPRSNPSPSPSPRAAPTTVAAPAPAPVSSAAIIAPEATPTPATASTPAVAAAALPAAAWPWWLVPAIVVGLLAWAGVALLWWRRRRERTAPTIEATPVAAPSPPAIEPAVAPAPVAPPVPIPPAPPASRPPGGLVTTALRPALELTLLPVTAGIDSLRATLDFQLVVRNTGRAPAYAVTVETWLFGAGTDPAADRNAALAQPVGAPLLPPFDMPAAASADLTGQVAAARNVLATIAAGARRLFVPMLVARIGWRDRSDEPGAFGAAFLIGMERPGQDRLAPLALDRGAREFRTLAARLLDG